MKHNPQQRDLPQKSKFIKLPLLHIGLVRLFAFGFGVSKCALPRADLPECHLQFYSWFSCCEVRRWLEKLAAWRVLGEGLSGGLSLGCHGTRGLFLSTEGEIRRVEGNVPFTSLSHLGWLWLHLPSLRACLTGEMMSHDYRSLLLNARLKKGDNYEKRLLRRGANCQIPWRVRDLSRNTAENTH